MYSLVPTRPSGQRKKIPAELADRIFLEKIRAAIIGSLPMSQPMKEIDERNCRRHPPRSALASSSMRATGFAHKCARLSEKSSRFIPFRLVDESESVSRARLRARSLDREFYVSSRFYDSRPARVIIGLIDDRIAGEKSAVEARRKSRSLKKAARNGRNEMTGERGAPF
jgi:hypothetical protein